MLAEPEPTRLTIAQTRAVRTLLLGKSMVETARTCEVSERTLRHWKQQPAFRAALDAGQAQLFEQTCALLTLAGSDAVQALIDVCRNPEAREATRVAAAGKLLNLLFRHMSATPALPAAEPSGTVPALPDALPPALLAGPDLPSPTLPHPNHAPSTLPSPQAEHPATLLPAPPPTAPTPTAEAVSQPPTSPGAPHAPGSPLPTPPLPQFTTRCLNVSPGPRLTLPPAHNLAHSPAHSPTPSPAHSLAASPPHCLTGSPARSHPRTVTTAQPHETRQKAARPGRNRSR